jgi:uncharacterized protein (DUF2249 family)
MTIGKDLGLSETGSCGCGAAHEEMPELDARAIPHAVRHAAIKGALASLQPGAGMVLVAPHDPVPLLQQVEAENPGVFAVEYVERGPEAWKLAFVRR